MVGQYSVSGGPLKRPGGPNGPLVCYLKYALPDSREQHIIHLYNMLCNIDKIPRTFQDIQGFFQII